MIITLIATTFLVALAALIHFEVLQYLADLMIDHNPHPRVSLLLGVLGALFAHVIEIGIFGVGYFVLTGYEQFGSLEGNSLLDMKDCWYFSFVTYTTLGFGDLLPKGPLRFLTGMEALTGLVLIAWTASFIYIQMQQVWKVKSTE